MHSALKRKMDPDLDAPMLQKKLHVRDDDNASVISNSSENSSTKNMKHADEFFNSPTKLTDPSTIDEISPSIGNTPKKKAKSHGLYEDVFKKYSKDPNSFIDTYKIVKYQNIQYKINDTLLVRNEDDASNDFIGMLLKIVKVKPSEGRKTIAFLEVQW